LTKILQPTLSAGQFGGQFVPAPGWAVALVLLLIRRLRMAQQRPDLLLQATPPRSQAPHRKPALVGADVADHLAATAATATAGDA
jgi:hypothetical protein